ncbi:GumC family protein [Thermocoleostomius sinensis]|uniref:Lipopolysaccharide biosynthesis n=1 Tax=Thermocoleostomius sinensis A174 TaxID=2016057 RepID=A0A9E8ZDG8_9CYAN|nr:tyrosine-protein kinase domain-containing protein [Thermocoleostomius sinensis]WAL59235.1 lipopolysaccharide biosynthesis [Thermocoleostomius sinensis A174]
MVPPIVKRYLIALDRHKWVGLASLIGVTGISGIMALLQPPPSVTFVAQGILAYSAPPETFSATGNAIQQQAQAVTKEALLSDAVLENASQQLAVQEIDRSPKVLQQRSKVVTNNPGTGEAGAGAALLRVSVAYSDSNEEVAKAVVKALMEAMIEQSRQFNSQQLDRILANLNQLLPKVSQELEVAERQLEEFIRLEGTALQAARSGALVNSITASQQQQRELRLNLAGIDAQLSSLQNRLGLTPDQAYAFSALSADPIIADLRSQIYQAEAQQDLLRKTLRPDHPAMVELQNQLDTFEQLLQARVTEVIGSGQAAPLVAFDVIRQASSLDPARQQLAATLVSLQTQRDSLREQLMNIVRSEQELRQEYARIPDQQLEQQRLQQQVSLKRSFYDQIQARLADVRLAQEETVGSLVVAQSPQVEAQPSTGPNSLVILLIGGFMGLGVSGGLIFLLGSLDSTLHTLEDVQSTLRQQDVPILGLLPLLPEAGSDDIAPPLLPVIEAVNSPYIDAYERLRGNLQRASGGRLLKLLIVTSTIAAEGKSTVAYNLAIASARAGKRTLLIESNLRSASQSASLHVSLDPGRMLEPLRYYGNLIDCVQLSPIENLYLVPSVGPQQHAAAIIDSSEMRRLLDDGRGRFDLVILDTPALSRYNDALLLEPQTDGLLLVTRPGYSEETVLNEAMQELIDSEQIKFIGAVINGIDGLMQPLPLEQHLEPYEVDHHSDTNCHHRESELISKRLMNFG